MLKLRIIAASSVALVAAGCASDPVYYSEPRHSSAPYYSSVSSGDFGRVVAIDVVRGDGRATGAGAVVGGIVGGVLGHQIGSGRGNDAATVAGAVGGAVAGHHLEKRRNDEEYRVTVETRDGRIATFSQGSLGDLRVGDRVRIADGRLYRD